MLYNYFGVFVQRKKVVYLEDLASEFNMRTQVGSTLHVTSSITVLMS